MGNGLMGISQSERTRRDSESAHREVQHGVGLRAVDFSSTRPLAANERDSLLFAWGFASARRIDADEDARAGYARRVSACARSRRFSGPSVSTRAARFVAR